MRWPIIWLIFRREVRDQVRDRRTLFMIFVLPILLYPILGIGVAQLSASFEQKPRTVVIVGREDLPESPPLLNEAGDRFEPSLLAPSAESGRLIVEAVTKESLWNHPAYRRVELRRGAADAVILVPPDLREKVGRSETVPITIAFDSADERGALTYGRAREVLGAWGDAIVAARLKGDGKPAGYAAPLRTRAENVATPAESGASVWARLFPFLLVMMALTGAFYPAVDICAGEKERGTMETLLICPATRTEIVLGKFFTVMLASVATALLNLLSMGLTGWQLASQVGAMAKSGANAAQPLIAAPSLLSAAWIVLILVPLSAFFSATCLALAVLARSMKEGQYYMTPLYMVALPLIFLTLAPGIKLDLFTSLVPITGVSLLLRALMQGEYGVARRYFLPVLTPTVVYGWIALRWAIGQFKREDVLFREAERLDMASWGRHLLRHKPATPGGGEALLCFALMLTSAWFLFGSMSGTLRGMVLGQLAFILVPPVGLALLLNSSPRRTLRLAWPKPRFLLMAAGLALALNPLAGELRVWVEFLFPTPEQVKVAIKGLEAMIPDLWTGLLVLAVVPAICEEVAFRGYILSGLLRGNSTRSAIILSAFLFGFMHVLLSLFQQFFNAALLGIILGYLAVRSRSLLPGICFHLLHNGLAVTMGTVATEPRWKALAVALYRDPAQGLYRVPIVAAGTLIAAVLVALLVREGADTPPDARPPLADSA